MVHALHGGLAEVQMLAMVLGVALAGPCAVDFVYEGQPACVELRFDAGRTELTNRCEQPLLVDQSVQPSMGLVAPGERSSLRDLQVFTLGMEGRLHRVVARPTEVCAAD